MQLTLGCPDPSQIHPAAQAELVGQAVRSLEQVYHLVQTLDEVPVGEKSALLSKIEGTADSLRPLYFVDAVY